MAFDGITNKRFMQCNVASVMPRFGELNPKKRGRPKTANPTAPDTALQGLVKLEEESGEHPPAIDCVAVTLAVPIAFEFRVS